MKGFDTFVAVIVLAATILALVYRQDVEEVLRPIIQSLF
jgi:hypothetical protein